LYFCFILIPLIFVFFCWITAQRDEAAHKRKVAADRAKVIALQNQQQFTSQSMGMMSPQQVQQGYYPNMQQQGQYHANMYGPDQNGFA